MGDAFNFNIFLLKNYNSKLTEPKVILNIGPTVQVEHGTSVIHLHLDSGLLFLLALASVGSRDSDVSVSRPRQFFFGLVLETFPYRLGLVLG